MERTNTRIQRTRRRRKGAGYDDSVATLEPTPQQQHDQPTNAWEAMQHTMGNQAMSQLAQSGSSPMASLQRVADAQGRGNSQASIAQLQGSAGNQAVLQLMRSGAITPVQREGDDAPTPQGAMNFWKQQDMKAQEGRTRTQHRFRGGKGTNFLKKWGGDSEPKEQKAPTILVMPPKPQEPQQTVGGQTVTPPSITTENKPEQQQPTVVVAPPEIGNSVSGTEVTTSGEPPKELTDPNVKVETPPITDETKTTTTDTTGGTGTTTGDTTSTGTDTTGGETTTTEPEKPNYEPRSMHDEYEQEALSYDPDQGHAYWQGNVNGTRVKYLSDDDVKEYELKLEKNVFHWGNEVFDSTKMEPFDSRSGQKGRAIFVMTEAGKVYVADEGDEARYYQKETGKSFRFNHSSCFRGSPVAAAGELWFENGVLKGVSDSSGHYRPELKHMLNVLRQFQSMGVDLSGVDLSLTGSRYINALDLLNITEDPDQQALDTAYSLLQEINSEDLWVTNAAGKLETAHKLVPEFVENRPGTAKRMMNLAAKDLKWIRNKIDKNIGKLDNSEALKFAPVVKETGLLLEGLKRTEAIYPGEVNSKLMDTVTTLQASVSSGNVDKTDLEQMKEQSQQAKKYGKKYGDSDAMEDELQEGSGGFDAKSWKEYRDIADSVLTNSDRETILYHMTSLYEKAGKLFDPALRASARLTEKARSIAGTIDLVLLEAASLESEGKTDEAEDARKMVEVLGVRALPETLAKMSDSTKNLLDEAFKDWDDGYLASSADEFREVEEGMSGFQLILEARLKERGKTISQFVDEVIVPGGIRQATREDDPDPQLGAKILKFANLLKPGSVPKEKIKEFKNM